MPTAQAQGVIGAVLPCQTAEYHKSLARDFKSKRTNDIPVLRMDWFSDPDIPSPGFYRVHWFTLNRSGLASTGVSSISNFARWPTLDKTGLLLLFEAVSRLPEPPRGTLPYERQIIISGIRSNEWFHAVYDRARIPKEVKEVFKRSEAHLEAYMP